MKMREIIFFLSMSLIPVNSYSEFEAEKKRHAEELAQSLLRAKEERKQQAIIAEQKEQEQRRLEAEYDAKDNHNYDYTVVKLPANFYVEGQYPLNNRGQVAGCISLQGRTWKPLYAHQIYINHDQYEDAKAAYWDPSKGLVLAKLADDKSITYGINDHGYAVIAGYSKKDNRVTLTSYFWSTDIDEIRTGPKNYEPIHINNSNMVLVKENNSKQTYLWKPIENTLDQCPGNYHYISENGKENFVTKNSNYILRHEDKNYLLLFDSEPSSIALSNNGSVAALVSNRIGTKDYYAIQIVDKNGKAIRSKRLRFPGDNGPVKILGFNNNGQILLQTGKGCCILSFKDK